MTCPGASLRSGTRARVVGGHAALACWRSCCTCPCCAQYGRSRLPAPREDTLPMRSAPTGYPPWSVGRLTAGDKERAPLVWGFQDECVGQVVHSLILGGS